MMVELGDRPKPPPRYADLKELERVLAENLPTTTSQVASFLGKRTPRVTKKRAASVRRRLHRFLESARPYLLALGALKGELDQKQCVYALLEGLLKAQLRTGGIKIREDQDAFEAWLSLARKAAAAPNAALGGLGSYQAIRQALGEFAAGLHRRTNPLMVQQIIGEWGRSKDARKYMQFVRQWPTLVRQYRHVLPKRWTMKSVMQLAAEYKECGSFVEQRLRLLVALGHASEGNPKSWSEWEKEGLNNLLQAVAARPYLNQISALIDRNVRNALAHGWPEVDVNSGECRFYGRETTVTWKFSEFFERTKALAVGVLALVQFEAILQLEQC